MGPPGAPSAAGREGGAKTADATGARPRETETRVRARALRHVHPSGRTALAGVDLDVRSGDRLVVMGPNGSGKTTLLHVLATALRPGGGELHLLGQRVPPPDPALRRRLGFVPDHAPHLDALDGRGNAALFGAAAGLSTVQVENRLTGLLECFQLADAAGVPVGAWSFGMRRKLLLVEALLHEPELLLLDEPSVGLDPDAVDALVEILTERTTGGTAVVAALNDPQAAARIGTRVVMLDEGRVVAEGTPEELLAALPRGVRCTVEVDGRVPALPQVAGVEIRATNAGRLEANLDGTHALPRLVQALVADTITIRSLSLREPDLGDVFRARTGRILDPGEET